MFVKPIVPIIGRNHLNDGNPGDAYILIGLQYLLHSAIGDYQPLLLNKFSEQQFLHYERMIRDAGFIIVGGTPQFNCYSDWCFWYDDQFWRHLEKWGVRAISLAGGAGFPDPRMTPDQFTERCTKDPKTMEILKRRKDCTIYQTVRDHHAQALIDAIGMKGETLPCSAFLAPEGRGLSSNNGSSSLVALSPCSPSNIPSDFHRGDPSAYHRKLFGDLYRALAARHDVIVLCHWFSEYENLKDVVPKGRIFATNDHHALLEMYKKCGTIVTARLHGAITAAGMGHNKVMHIAVDTRCSAIDVLNEWSGEDAHVYNFNIDDPNLVEEAVAFASEERTPASNINSSYYVSEGYRKMFEKYLTPLI